MIFNIQEHSTLNLTPNINLSINIALQSSEISVKLNASNIVPEGVSRKKTRKQIHATIFAMTSHTLSAFHTAFSMYTRTNEYHKNQQLQVTQSKLTNIITNQFHCNIMLFEFNNYNQLQNYFHIYRFQ